MGVLHDDPYLYGLDIALHARCRCAPSGQHVRVRLWRGLHQGTSSKRRQRSWLASHQLWLFTLTQSGILRPTMHQPLRCAIGSLARAGTTCSWILTPKVNCCRRALGAHTQRGCAAVRVIVLVGVILSLAALDPFKERSIRIIEHRLALLLHHLGIDPTANVQPPSRSGSSPPTQARNCKRSG
jgi:hypothetical protein